MSKEPATVATETAMDALQKLEKAEKASREAAMLLQQTFASLNEAVFIVQSGTRVIVDANSAVETMFGYAHHEIVGKLTSCLHLNEQMFTRFGSEMIKGYQEKGYYETIYQMIRKDGTVFESEHCVTPIRDISGTITSHVCVVRDISERVHAERALVEKSRLLRELNDSLEARIEQAVEELRKKDDVLASQNRLLVDLAPEAIIVFDVELDRIVDANAKAEQLFGCSREILLMSTPRQFYMQKQPDGRPPETSFFENSDRAIAGEVLVIERAIRSAAGTEVVCEVRLVRLPSPQSLLIRASFFDITERMQTQKKLTRALASEHRLNEEQRQFMGLVSHELRTPLSIIDGSAQLLALAACKDKECLAHANRILSSTQRLSTLIDTCLTEERLCTSGWTPNIVSEDIRCLTRNVVAQAQAGTERHLIKCDPEELPDRYDCDPMLLQVLLNNLLDNAVKYSPKGGEINVRGWRADNGDVCFEVTDQGIGIAADQLEKAFDRFYRIWQIPGIAGAGLGLHIVKRIAELHGGTASCSSVQGCGSTFTVRLCNPRNS
ncbi:MAG: PAS domain S-box protein [Pelobacteraceae bacterium]